MIWKLQTANIFKELRVLLRRPDLQLFRSYQKCRRGARRRSTKCCNYNRLQEFVKSGVHRHYFNPDLDAFKPRTLWSLSNAFTSAFKNLKPVRQFQATAKLRDFLVGYQFSQGVHTA
jgi:hypothetical protein